MKPFPHNKKGFTLTELVLVMGILGILFGIGITSYIEQKKQLTYNDSLTKILSLINTARNYSITSRTVEDTSVIDIPATPDNEQIYIPKEGYGIHISKTNKKLTLFANTSTTGDLAKQFDFPGDIIEEELELPIEVVFEKILKNDKNTEIPSGEAIILFKPPLAEVFVGNNLDTNLIETLFLQLRNYNSPVGKTHFILINRNAGFPEIEFNPPPVPDPITFVTSVKAS